MNKEDDDTTYKKIENKTVLAEPKIINESLTRWARSDWQTQ